MDWRSIGAQLAGIGLPLLGGALGGPGGALVGKGIAAALGLGASATPEQAATALGNMTGEQLVALRAIEADQAKSQLAADSKRDEGQVEINKIEAASTSFFKSGWRPASGWLCVVGLGYTFFLRPLLPWLVNAVGASVPPLPAIDTMELMTLLGGLLGLGGMRMFERVKGKA